MRVLILAALIAAATADFWEVASTEIESLGTKLSSGIAAYGLLNEDQSDWHDDISMYLEMGEGAMCPSQYEKCGAGAWLLGCNCQSAINALPGDCPQAPCELYKTLTAAGPGLIKELLSDSSLGVKADVVLTDVVRPIYESLCSCRGLIGAAETCVRQYDGFMLSANETERQEYFSVVEDVPWKPVKRILKSVLDVLCENGCGDAFGEVIRNIATLWENSLSGEYQGDACMSLRRVEDEIAAFMGVFGLQDVSVRNGWKQLTEKYLDMEEAMLCGSDCAGVLQENFYNSCCTVSMGRLVNSTPFQTKIRKLVGEYVADEKYKSNVMSFFKSYVKPWNPAAFCGDSTEVYQGMDNICDLEA